MSTATQTAQAEPACGLKWMARLTTHMSAALGQGGAPVTKNDAYYEGALAASGAEIVAEAGKHPGFVAELLPGPMGYGKCLRMRFDAGKQTPKRDGGEQRIAET